GTVVCGLAPSFELLVAARAVTGVFAGLTAPLIMALISDGFPEAKRGGALGTVMAGFALASVLGVPLGLHLALLSSWRLPFLV
ncbi:MFS transporter, partial [Acinetobacter baumannii]